MTRYILRRLLFLPLILFGVTLLIFGILQLLDPAERAALYVHQTPKSPTEVRDMIQKYGLDKPIWEQYGQWLGNLAHGDLGWSRTAQRPVLDAIRYYFPATLELALLSLIPIVVGGVWLGVQAAVHHDQWIDHSARIFSIAGTSLPAFVFALLLLMVFYANLHWLPPGRLSDEMTQLVNAPSFHQYTGMYTVDGLLNNQPQVTFDALKHLLLPVLTLALINWAVFVRVTRTAMLDVLNQDYMRTARAKGLKDRALINAHALRNALIPIATLSGLVLISLLNGVIITETVYNFHGMGWFAANAALRLDVVSILGITLFTAILLVLTNLAVDLLYGVLDPRVRVNSS